VQRHLLGARTGKREGEQPGVAVGPARLVQALAVPSDVRQRDPGRRATGEKTLSVQIRVAPAQRDHLAREAQHVAVGIDQTPVEP
jgi:hypothetical protein